MRELRTEILISSKPEIVWETIRNLSDWPKWNPIVNKLEGKFEVGAELSITMSDSKGNDGKNTNPLSPKLIKIPDLHL